MHQQHTVRYASLSVQCRNLILFCGHICFVLSNFFLRSSLLICLSIMIVHFVFVGMSVRKCIPDIKGEKEIYPLKILWVTFLVNFWSFILFPVVVLVGLLFTKEEISFATWLYLLFPEALLFGIYESIATGIVLVNTGPFKRGTIGYSLNVLILFFVYYILSVFILAKLLMV